MGSGGSDVVAPRGSSGPDASRGRRGRGERRRRQFPLNTNLTRPRTEGPVVFGGS